MAAGMPETPYLEIIASGWDAVLEDGVPPSGEQPRVAQDKLVSSTLFIVFNRSAHVAAIAQKEHEQIYPQPGWVEHNAEEIWQHLGNWGCSSGLSQ